MGKKGERREAGRIRMGTVEKLKGKNGKVERETKGGKSKKIASKEKNKRLIVCFLVFFSFLRFLSWNLFFSFRLFYFHFFAHFYFFVFFAILSILSSSFLSFSFFIPQFSLFPFPAHCFPHDLIFLSFHPVFF